MGRLEKRHIVKNEGGKKYLIIDFKGLPYGASISEFPQAMAMVIDLLRDIDADLVVLTEAYDRIYDENQTQMLREIADMLIAFELEGVWSPSHLSSGPAGEEHVSKRHDTILTIINTTLYDPFGAYVKTLEEIKAESARIQKAGGEYEKDSQVYLETLTYIYQSFEKTKLIKKMKTYLLQLKALPEDRSMYHSLFEAQMKPGFVGSRLISGEIEKLTLVDQYSVGDTPVSIYRHPDKIQYLYYLNPPEYNLPPDKFFLLTKTKEVVAGHRPATMGFADLSQARRYFKRIYITTIADIARKNNISISQDEREALAEMVARYTIGYGILEIILSDRRLTDVYIDSPLGQKPIYVVHSDYGQCESNILFSEGEAKSTVSRFRALSGRPFDEAHPILDFDLSQLETRVCVIGPPMATDGIAFALRMHKTTPWTLPQFVDGKMLDSFTAGLFSFFIDAQASTIIAGSRGSGKTSLTQALMLEIPQNLRLIIQEDTLELPVPYMKNIGFNIQRLKTKPPIGGGAGGEVAPEDALRTALRLGDSVLIVGEVRSGEAKVLYEAMRVGAVGNVVMGTIHGESAYSVWDRIVNDLDVPTTSFKATDLVIVAAPIRFKGSFKRHRRVIEVTEVLKHWTSDPEKEEGFINLLEFNAKDDKLTFMKENIERSELFAKIKRMRGLTDDEIWANVDYRAKCKQYLVDLKNKLKYKPILEAENTVYFHNKSMLLLERQREDTGSANYDEAFSEWKSWINSVVKDMIQKDKE